MSEIIKLADMVKGSTVISFSYPEGSGMISILPEDESKAQLLIDKMNELVEENAKLKEALYSMVRITPEWDEWGDCVYCGTRTVTHTPHCALQIAKELVKDMNNEND